MLIALRKMFVRLGRRADGGGRGPAEAHQNKSHTGIHILRGVNQDMYYLCALVQVYTTAFIESLIRQRKGSLKFHARDVLPIRRQY